MSERYLREARIIVSHVLGYGEPAFSRQDHASVTEVARRLEAEAIHAAERVRDAAAHECSTLRERARAHAKQERGADRGEAFAEANGMAVCADRVRALKVRDILEVT